METISSADWVRLSHYLRAKFPMDFKEASKQVDVNSLGSKAVDAVSVAVGE